MAWFFYQNFFQPTEAVLKALFLKAIYLALNLNIEHGLHQITSKTTLELERLSFLPQGLNNSHIITCESNL